VTTPSDPLPTDLAAAHAMILAQREQPTLAKSEVSDNATHQKCLPYSLDDWPPTKQPLMTRKTAS
jgi:hypothetical protein